jgi:hypothetical protein
MTSMTDRGKFGDGTHQNGRGGIVMGVTALRTLWTGRLTVWLARLSYRPERHYMRGPSRTNEPRPA